MEVETLLQQMQDTLSEIRTTVNELSTKEHDERLDQLEHRRDQLLADLHASFERERGALERKRQSEIEDLKKRRKQEDEEREARRRREDEDLKKRDSNEDKERQRKLENDADSVEYETEQQMDDVEEAARKMIQNGQQKLQDLEDKRRELNRRIDKQLEGSVPTVPTRKRARSKKEPESHLRDTTANDPVSAEIQGSDSGVELPGSDGEKTPLVTEITPLAPNEFGTLNNQNGTSPKPVEASPERISMDDSKVKQHGELPLNNRSKGLPQSAARDSSKDAPRSFAEALKNDLSSESMNDSMLEQLGNGHVREDEDDQGELNYNGASGDQTKEINEVVRGADAIERYVMDEHVSGTNKLDTIGTFPWKYENTQPGLSGDRDDVLPEEPITQLPSRFNGDSLNNFGDENEEMFTEAEQLNQLDSETTQLPTTSACAKDHRAKTPSHSSTTFSLASGNSPWYEERLKATWWRGSPSPRSGRLRDDGSGDESDDVEDHGETAIGPHEHHEGWSTSEQANDTLTWEVQQPNPEAKLQQLNVQRLCMDSGAPNTSSDDDKNNQDHEITDREFEIRNKLSETIARLVVDELPKNGQGFPSGRKSTPNRNHSPADGTNMDIDTVGSSSAIQLTGVSSPPEERKPGQNNQQDDQMELTQTTVSNSFEQYRLITDGEFKRTPNQSPLVHHLNQALRNTDSMAIISSIRGDLVSPLDKPEHNFSPDLGTSAKFKNRHDLSPEDYLSIRQPQQQGSTSPLPVENETVCGHEQLFDDDTSTTSAVASTDDEYNIDPYQPVNGYDVPQVLAKKLASDEHEIGKLTADDGTIFPNDTHGKFFEPSTPRCSTAKEQKVTLDLCTEGCSPPSNTNTESLPPPFEDWRYTLSEEHLSEVSKGCATSMIEPLGHTWRRSRKPSKATKQIDMAVAVNAAVGEPGSDNSTQSSSPVQSNMKGKLMHHPSLLLLKSPIPLTLRKPERNLPTSQDYAHAGDQHENKEHSPSNPATVLLYSQVLSGRKAQCPPKQGSNSQRVSLFSSEKSKNKVRSNSVEAHPKRPTQRGRQRSTSLQKPIRSMDPRSQLFQESDDDIDIKSAWFKHSSGRKHN
ncbi:hypothetical protein F5Y19DRAFT_487276 [Xylariaceae sp. FL1651]|nr:hypothetical protein F5Y19DRAFT_487276 [Xylariaceae sp. FL1651]